MTSINLNTMLFDSDIKTEADQAVLMPSGSVPVIVIFGDSITSGGGTLSFSDADDAREIPEARIYDSAYQGQKVGEVWNNWLTTSDGGATFSSNGRTGTTGGSGAFVGDGWEEAVSLGGRITDIPSTDWENLTNIWPWWGFLREIHGLFRDDQSGEIIPPKIICFCRSGSFVSKWNSADASAPGLSWAPFYSGQTFSFYKSPYDCLVERMAAAQTALAGTESYLVGVFTAAGSKDTTTSLNTTDGAVETNPAAFIGEGIQDIRVALQDEFELEPFPMVAALPRLVPDSNDLKSLGQARQAYKDWAKKYDMSSFADMKFIDYERLPMADGDATDPHPGAQGAFELGVNFGKVYRWMLADIKQITTAPQFSI